MSPQDILHDLRSRHGWDFTRVGFTSAYRDGNIHLEFARNDAGQPIARLQHWSKLGRTAPEVMALDSDDLRTVVDGLNANLQSMRLLDQMAGL